ncbi:hypothetical protein Droror1_Dr00024947 [Drosera rotundifolia]
MRRITYLGLLQTLENGLLQRDNRLPQEDNRLLQRDYRVRQTLDNQLRIRCSHRFRDNRLRCSRRFGENRSPTLDFSLSDGFTAAILPLVFLSPFLALISNEEEDK